MRTRPATGRWEVRGPELGLSMGRPDTEPSPIPIPQEDLGHTTHKTSAQWIDGGGTPAPPLTPSTLLRPRQGNKYVNRLVGPKDGKRKSICGIGKEERGRLTP